MIRKYSNSDKIQVLNLLKLNTPKYFDPTEEEDLRHYLEEKREDYFVYEEDGKIIGAGGINYFPNEQLARISWDMVHPNSQGKGVGRQLTQYRIDYLKQQPNIHTIVVRTTQLVYKFYEKMGFELKKVEKDFWAKDFDLYLMKYKNG